MALLPKERLGEVVAINFGDPNRSEPTTKEWTVGSGETATSNPPSGQQVSHAAALEPTPQQMTAAVDQNTEPPVFEISEDILRAFYEEAVAAGLEDGKSQVFAELTVLQERYASGIEQLRSAGQQLAGQNQAQIIKLACFMAEKLVRNHLKVNPTDLLAMVEEAIGAQNAIGTVTVACSEGDFEFLSARLESLTGADGSLLQVNVVLDETLEYGDFQIETLAGNIDGRVAGRVGQVAESIAGVDHA